MFIFFVIVLQIDDLSIRRIFSNIDHKITE
jgi:hypothetical protein